MTAPTNFLDRTIAPTFSLNRAQLESIGSGLASLTAARRQGLLVEGQVSYVDPDVEATVTAVFDTARGEYVAHIAP